MTLAVAVLIASLLGSVHCAAMCGAFTCLYAPAGSSWTESRGAHLTYNVGRLVSYLLLGLVAGALGAAFSRAGVLAGVSNAATLLAAVLLILWGVHALVVATGGRVGVIRPPESWQNAMGSVLQRFAGKPPIVRAAAVGLLTTLLPCGWLYAFVVTASGTGSPVGGATVMVFFWMGTVPMMLAVGAGLQRLTGRFRERLPVISAATIVLLGALSLAAHLDLLPLGRSVHRWLPSVPTAAGEALPAHGHGNE